MMDCVNAQIRDLLPDYAAGRLDAGDREKVDRHLASCAECVAELALVRSVRRALDVAPPVDVSGIVAALPRPPRPARPDVVPIGSRRPAGAGRRPTWAPRRVAAIAAVAVAAVGLAVAGDRVPRRRVVAEAPVAALPGSAAAIDAQSPATPAAATSELSFASGLSDLSDESLRSLLRDVEDIDDSPLADPAEALPAVSGVEEDSGV